MFLLLFLPPVLQQDLQQKWIF
jgi:hypothetical protein